MRIRFILVVAALSLLSLFPIACVEEQPAAPEPATVTETVEPAPSEIAEGLSTPESVLYDPDQDVYFISNINGSPFAEDDNGFISRVAAEDLSGEMNWIDGAKEDVTLNAPKGMAIVGDELWVTDIKVVRRFNRQTGAPAGVTPIRGASFLNDLASSGDTAWVSDSGLNESFQSSGTEAIYRIRAGGAPEKIASGRDLNGPNGLAVDGESVWVVTFGSNELFPIDGGRKGTVTQLPRGGLDGLIRLEDGSMLVSSWDGQAIYRGTPGGTFTPVVENLQSPADIGYDSRRNRVLIPLFEGNRVVVREIE